VLVVQAERALYGLFARHMYRLWEIATDPERLTQPAYGDHAAAEHVDYPVLLAVERDGWSGTASRPSICASAGRSSGTFPTVADSHVDSHGSHAR
jgi:hypothetical protein